jgi:hypothetical protein
MQSFRVYRFFVDQLNTIGARRQQAIQGYHNFKSHALHDKISYRKNRWYKHPPIASLISYRCFTWSDGSRAHKGKASKGDIANCALRHLYHYLFGRHPSTVEAEVAFHQVVACQQQNMLSQSADMCSTYIELQ